jgi:hypothetical protein
VSASAKQQYEQSSRRGSEALRNLSEWGKGLRDSLLGVPLTIWQDIGSGCHRAASSLHSCDDCLLGAGTFSTWIGRRHGGAGTRLQMCHHIWLCTRKGTDTMRRDHAARRGSDCLIPLLMFQVWSWQAAWTMLRRAWNQSSSSVRTLQGRSWKQRRHRGPPRRALQTLSRVQRRA